MSIDPCDRPRVYLLREAADYKRDLVSEVQAARALQRARAFILVSLMCLWVG
jgi:hypothetical protein